MKKLIKSNTWYTYEQAELELRKHWNPNNDVDGTYLNMQRRQIQKILRSDIIGTYLEIDKRVDGFTEDELFEKNLYGWKSEELFYLDTIDKESDQIIEKEYREKLHVFPKYDRLSSKGETSIILSALDEELNDKTKLEMREVYEELYKNDVKGRTSYLMTKEYLYALKHEIERREHPQEVHYLKPHSPTDILRLLSENLNEEKLLDLIANILDDFDRRINKKVRIHNDARDVEKDRYMNISDFLRIRGDIFPKDIEKIIMQLEKDGLYESFLTTRDKLKNPFVFELDIDNQKKKLRDKFFEPTKITMEENKFKNSLKRSIYSYEKYNLEKFERALLSDNKMLSEANRFRHRFNEALRNHVEEYSENSEYLLGGLDINGIT